MKKFKCLKKTFFFLSNVNLNDINNFIYADSLTLTKNIERKINKAIAKLKANKAFETNQIFNRMLKLLRKTMTKKLVLIFQACINVEYIRNHFEKQRL